MAALERLRIGMICAKARTDTIALVERVNDLRSDFGVIVAVPERSGRRLFFGSAPVRTECAGRAHEQEYGMISCLLSLVVIRHTVFVSVAEPGNS